MSWNFRVVKCKDDFEDEYYVIREVYYNYDGSIKMMSEESAVVLGNTPDDIKDVLQKMIGCLDKDTLIENDIVFVDLDDATPAP